MVHRPKPIHALKQVISEWTSLTTREKKKCLMDIIKQLGDEDVGADLPCDGTCTPSTQVELIKEMLQETNSTLMDQQLKLTNQGKSIKEIRKENSSLKERLECLEDELAQSKRLKLANVAASLAADVLFVYQNYKKAANVEEIFGNSSELTRLALKVKANRVQAAHPGKSRQYKFCEWDDIKHLILTHYPTGGIITVREVSNVINVIENDLRYKDSINQPFLLW